MKKLCMMIALALLLVGCNDVKNEEKNNDKISEFTEQAFAINDLEKEFMQELSKETVEDFVFQMKDENHKLIVLSEEYGAIAEGLADGANGKKTNCYKLPVTFSFSGNESLIREFLRYFENSDKKIVMNKFEAKENDADYLVNCIVSFIGSSAKTGVHGVSNSLSFVKNTKEVKEEEEIVLRDFDVNLTVRPSNSDASAITLSTDAGNVLYSDKNATINVNVNFYKEGNQHYCKYSVGDQSKTDKLSVSDAIIFDILSCERKIDTDEISVNLTIENSTSKKVSAMIYNDSDKRIKVTKSGSVEVSKK